MQDRSKTGEVSSPVVSTLNVYIIAALAAKEKRHVTNPLLASFLCNIDPSYQKFLNPDDSIVVYLTKTCMVV
jgi:hypothetical protein